VELPFQSTHAMVYREEPIRFQHGSTTLGGTLCLPVSRPPPYPAVAYVSGSGPSGRDGWGSLPPLWAMFAQRGIASFAWDKPGVGESTGDWRAQTNADRADEVVQAIQVLKQHPALHPRKIGLWGISQAGWVLPLVCMHVPDIAFLIAVSVPAGTGAEQELFRVAHGLPADGFSPAETAQAVAFTKQRLALMQQHADYAAIEALQQQVANEPWFAPLGWLDQGVYEFLQANAFSSPQPLLAHIHCSVLAIFGARDTIVDVQESVAVYTRLLREAGNNDVTIKIIPDADHAIFPSKTGGLNELNQAFAQPIKVFAPRYLETIGQWVQERVAAPGE
jgi:pimeloyl-ACP methyl ester carboxylesterase